MSLSKVEIPADVLPREKVESILTRWDRKRQGLLGPLLFRDSSKRRLTRLEKFLIPHYLFTFHQSTRSGVEIHYLLIDAVCGFGAFTNGEPELCTRETREPAFRVLIPEKKAGTKARDWLARWNLRKHAFHLKPPEILSTQVRFFHFPFWVAFYVRPSGKVDLEVVDGVRGYIEGGRTKHLIKQGLAALDGNAGAGAPN